MNDPAKKSHPGWHSRGYLPHADFAGMTQVVTFRLADSMPASVVASFRQESLQAPNVDSHFRAATDRWLDAGHGSCVLACPPVQKLVLDAILEQDGTTYRLDAVVVMPNHVHVLLGAAAGTLGNIVKHWKGPTARQINLACDTKGSVWYQEHYDRFIRDEEHFFTALRYLVDNPVKAGLVPSAQDWPGTWVCDELRKAVFPT